MKPWRLAFLVVGATFSLPSTARARCCTSDSDCPRGFQCTGAGTVPGAVGSCSSVAAPCQCNSDCAPGLRCQLGAYTLCLGSSPGSCSFAGECVAPWQAACGTDTDCGGGGFTCAQNGTQCGGGTCQSTASCSFPPLPAACASNDNCPVGWTCEAADAVTIKCVPCGGPGGPMTLPGPPLLTGSGQSQCRPPQWELVGCEQFDGPANPPATCKSLDGGSNASSSVPDVADGGDNASGEIVDAASSALRSSAGTTSSGCRIGSGTHCGTLGLCMTLLALAEVFRRARRRNWQDRFEQSNHQRATLRREQCESKGAKSLSDQA
jgi:hypothetical protein